MQPQLTKLQTTSLSGRERTSNDSRELTRVYIELDRIIEYTYVLPAVRDYLGELALGGNRLSVFGARLRQQRVASRLGEIAAFEAGLTSHPEVTLHRSIVITDEEAEGAGSHLQRYDPSLPDEANAARQILAMQLAQCGAESLRRIYDGSVEPCNPDESGYALGALEMLDAAAQQAIMPQAHVA